MIEGQILIYRYNGLHNAKEGVDRNSFTITNVEGTDKDCFRMAIEDALDSVPSGKGYVLIKWKNRLFICEKDLNNPEVSYVRHEIAYHPLQDKFTI